MQAACADASVFKQSSMHFSHASTQARQEVALVVVGDVAASMRGFSLSSLR